MKGLLRNDKWASKILFSFLLAVLVVLVASWSAAGTLLDSVNTISNGYGVGYTEAGYRAYGYHTYGYQPIKDYQGDHALKPNGSLVRVSGENTIYWIDEGVKRNVMSPVAFASWGFDWASVVTITAAELSGYNVAKTAAGNYLLMRPGTLVRSTASPSVYVFGFDDQLHHIMTPAVFTALGLRWADIGVIGAAELGVYTIGDDISSSSIWVDGTLIKGDASPRVYFWEDSGTTYVVEWIRSGPAFVSWGFNWDSIIVIDQFGMNALVASSGGTDIMAKPGTLLRGTGNPVYVTDVLAYQEQGVVPPTEPTYYWKKRWVPSPAIFTAKGYRWEDVMIETDAELLNYLTEGNVQ